MPASAGHRLIRLGRSDRQNTWLGLGRDRPNKRKVGPWSLRGRMLVCD